MERDDPIALDLDEADAEIQHRWFVWTAAGLNVHPVTWTPRSLGLHVSRPAAHADIVLYTNGWTEVAVRRPEASAVVHEKAQLGSVEAFAQLLDRVVELITWNGVPRDHGSPAGSLPRPERAARWVLGVDGRALEGVAALSTGDLRTPDPR